MTTLRNTMFMAAALLSATWNLSPAFADGNQRANSAPGWLKPDELPLTRTCGTLQLRSLVPNPGVQTPLLPRESGVMPSVGDTRVFWTYDLSVMPPKNKSITATCRGVGTDTAVWVGDAAWNTKVSQTDVDALLSAMETSTPASASEGVVAANTRLFGLPPYVALGDPLLTILVYDIPTYQGNAFDGYFRAEDLAPFNPACETSPMLYCSNELAMIHVDATNIGSEYMAGVVAHEFEHLIHYGVGPGEEPWLDESMAELAMVYSGYEDPSNLAWFAKHPENSLVVPPPVDYGACLLFGSYLWEVLGDAGISALVADPAKGITSILDAIDASDFGPFFGMWALSNAVDLPDLPGPLGHSKVDPPNMTTTDWGTDLTAKTVSVPAYATKYYKVNPEADSNQSLYVMASNTSGVRVLFWNSEVLHGDITGQASAHVGTNPSNGIVLVFANPTAGQASIDVSFALDAKPDTPVEPQPDSDSEDVITTDSLESDMATEDIGLASDLGQDLSINPEIQKQDTESDGDSPDSPGSGGGSGGCNAPGKTAGTRGPAMLIALVVLVLSVARRRYRGHQGVGS